LNHPDIWQVANKFETTLVDKPAWKSGFETNFCPFLQKNLQNFYVQNGHIVNSDNE